VIGRARFGADQQGAIEFAKLMGQFGQTTNALSFLFSLFGFSFVVRTLGLRRTLRLFPFLLLTVVVFSSAIPNLTVLFFSISLLKALTYSLNEPAMELLYMPTTEAIKFKAKAWIDVVGARTMKALGSAITHSAGSNPALLVRYGSVPTLLVSLALLGISILAGRRFEDLRATGEIVGEEDSNKNQTYDSLQSSSSWYDDDEDEEDEEEDAGSNKNRRKKQYSSSSKDRENKLNPSFDRYSEEHMSPLQPQSQNKHTSPTTQLPQSEALRWEPALNKIIHSRNHEKVTVPKRSVSDPSIGDLLNLPAGPIPPPPSVHTTRNEGRSEQGMGKKQREEVSSRGGVRSSMIDDLTSAPTDEATLEAMMSSSSKSSS
jgi:hypothetical protein